MARRGSDGPVFPIIVSRGFDFIQFGLRWLELSNSVFLSSGFRGNTKSLLFHSLTITVLLVNLTGCAQPWLDHPTSASLEQELAERSKHGLALAMFSKSEPNLDLAFSMAVRTCCIWTAALPWMVAPYRETVS
jgi:hypothetical protein